MKLKTTLAAVALAATAFGANATLTASTLSSSGSFLTLSSTGATTGTLDSIGTIAGGEVLSGDYSYADSQAFGSPAGGTYLAAGITAGTPAVLTFTTPISYVSFLWGSPDTYNTLTVTTNLGTYTYTPGSSSALSFSSVSGSQSYAQYVAFAASAGETILSLTFSSTSNAFEAANFSVTPVPEPETYALLLGGLGALGFLSRRRQNG